MHYHAIPCNTMQYHAIPFNITQYHAKPCNTMQYHAMPCSTMQYRAISCNTMQYHAVPINTMQYHLILAIQCNIMHYLQYHAILSYYVDSIIYYFWYTIQFSHLQKCFVVNSRTHWKSSVTGLFHHQTGFSLCPPLSWRKLNWPQQNMFSKICCLFISYSHINKIPKRWYTRPL